MSTAEQSPAAGGRRRRRRPRRPASSTRSSPPPGPRPTSEADRAKDYFQQFLDQVVKPGQVVSKDVETNIKFWIGEIDKKLSAQLNEVMHHPDFQKLEGDLARPALPGPPDRDRREPQDPRPERHQAGAVQGPGEGRRVRPERAVQEDLRGGVRPARRPALRHARRRLRVRPQRRGRQPAEDDLATWPPRRTPRSSPTPARRCSTSTRFTELANPRDLAKIFEAVEYAAWKSFRESEDSRYVALTMPRVLARLPYGATSSGSTSSTSRRSSTARTTTSTCG